jgi:hypothetical protein
MRNRHGQEGFALVLVLMLIGITASLGLAYMSSASVKLQSSQNMMLMTRSKYLAESGLEHAWYMLRESPELLTGTAASPHGPFTIDETDDTYVFWSEPGASEGLYVLSAEGSSGGISRRVAVTVHADNTFYNHALYEDAVGYWRLGETSGGKADDSAGKASGTYKNGVSRGEAGALIGEEDGASLFDGANDYVDIGKLDLSGQRMTLMAWVYIPSDSVRSRTTIIASSSDADVDDVSWGLGTVKVSGQQRLAFQLTTTSGQSELIATNTDLSLIDGWHLVTAVYTGWRMELYIDGDEVAWRSASGNVAGTGKGKGKDKDKDKGKVWIGGMHKDAGKYAFKGWIDEVAVFKDALSAEQIAEFYKLRYPNVDVVFWND